MLEGWRASGSPALPILAARLRYLLVVVGLGFLVLLGRLWQLQIIRGDRYREQTVSNVVERSHIASLRGKILDRKGRPLAENRPAFNIYVQTKAFTPELAQALETTLGLSAHEMELMSERIERARGRKQFRQYQRVLEDQGRDRATLVDESLRYRFAGIEVRTEPQRHYPSGALAAHVLGYMSQMSAGELQRLEADGYEADETIGRFGLELEWEAYLRGKKGLELFAEDAHHNRLDDMTAARFIGGPMRVEPIAGHNLVSTIDIDLQRVAEAAVAKHEVAAVVVVEVATGKLLAVVSKPAFDPNVMSGRLSAADSALLMSNPHAPFLDKALRATYPPGSVFKFVTGIAALEEGRTRADEHINCPGSYTLGRTSFRCTHVHGKVDMQEAIAQSCNVYFYNLAERMGLDPIVGVAHRFGFGMPTGLGLNGDGGGRVPTRTWYKNRGGYSAGKATNASIGQGDVEVTVLQVAMAYAALANGGTLYVPQIVDRVESVAGQVVMQYQPRIARVVKVAPSVLSLMTRGMVDVVARDEGTAFAAVRSNVVAIAGKTGTAQVVRLSADRGRSLPAGWHRSKEHAWFAGWAPAGAPEIAIAVLIEHGGTGGTVAGPVVKSVIEQYFKEVKRGP
ncbi:MAG: penicillin-binding protein 2 [Myxococcales bacterium]|nr:penicillin-binding protein 2 [Myxococcales bacterium]